MSREEVPPWLREQLARFEQSQRNLQAILAQKQQIELEISEIERATAELKKIGPDDTVYKHVGSILIKVKRDDMLKDLEEKREIDNTRSAILAKQETRLRESIKELQAKINEALRSKSPSST
ncbi:MAG: prefoldin subunit beta [archaeon]|nr:prefoldin subunit beta [archaeon]MCP8306256.1 prefoldin subunit beta [archaeon]